MLRNPLKSLLSRLLIKLQGLSLYGYVIRYVKPPYEIRQANKSDLERRNRWFFGGDKRRIENNDRVTNFIAASRKEIIGSVQLVRQAGNAGPYQGHWLFSLIVKVRYRRMGVGAQLSEAVIAQARKEGAKEVSLFVREDDKSAIGVYRKLGFSRVIIPEIEERLAKEASYTGRRRITMTKKF